MAATAAPNQHHPLTVDRCICAHRRFDELLDAARSQGLSLQQLLARTGASAGCGMCRPYLCRAFRTGQTTFHELLDADDEPDPHADR